MTKRLPTKERREEIVSTTLELLSKVPAETLTTRQVARALGLSQPALFRHFVSRDRLLLAVVERARAELEALAVPILERPGSGLQRLEALALGLLDHVARHPGLPRLLFASAGPAAGSVQRALRQLVSMQRALIEQLVLAAQSEEELSRGHSASDLAASFLGLVQGIILDWELHGRTRSPAERLPALFTLWLGGAARAGSQRTSDTGALHAGGPRSTARSGTAARALRSMIALDVRPILSGGADPLAEILAGLDELVPGGALILTAPFRPAPLFALLRGRGHAVTEQQLTEKKWLVLIVSGGQPAIEDLRDLEAPGPLERVLERVASLGAGEVYLARVPRMPRLLLTRLHERRLAASVEELPDGSALVRVEGR